MADTETEDRTAARKVQVANLPATDSGRGFARLPDRLMDALALEEGDGGAQLPLVDLDVCH